MVSGTLSIRRPTAAPARRIPARSAPLLSADLASAIRDALPTQSFFDTFDELLDRQHPRDPSPAVRRVDRAVLGFLLTYRWCVTRPTPDEIAQRLGRSLASINASVARLHRCALLPLGDTL